MQEKIHFDDLASLKNVLPLIIGTLLCFISGVLIVINEPNLYMGLTGAIGIALIGIPQIKNIRRRNTIKYNSSGLTAKLLGHKTFGFQFQDLKQFNLTDSGLILNIKEMDEITLSRKRFQKDSLQQLHTLIQQKTEQ